MAISIGVRAGLGAAVLSLCFSALAFSQEIDSASAAPTNGTEASDLPACFVPPAKLTDVEIAGFLAAPQALLTTYPSGGLALSSKTRALAGSDARALRAILALGDSATPAQNAAIGAGLASVVDACGIPGLAYAGLVQRAVADLGSENVLVAFAATLNDIRTAALSSSQNPAAVGSFASLSEADRMDGAPNFASFGGDVSTPIEGFSFSVGSAGRAVPAVQSPTSPPPN